ncbi:S41 family peptidase [Pedobacter sp. SYP-B3415]|uniref:S41 family peptidase n=1 Tax=Pedobacter sp. SYP-B3415 TaxID=2496641 RepID=UPI001F0E8077|nr:S41 family peptidase [Pedobacter sp. SYP-B3415]
MKFNFTKFAFAAGLLMAGMTAKAQNEALWLRYPALSPDGKTIVFGYKGDLYKIPASGGTATPLTISEYHEQMPVWSRDGKSIAFASNRYGNFDVFVIPANGGTASRLTFNSVNDYPSDFSADSKKVLFSSAHHAPAKSVRFPSPRLFMNLYSVPADGSTKPVLISAAGIENAHYNADGSQIVFQDRKGYEDPFRKHHTSSVTRDLWTLELKNSKYTKITDFNGEDREPVFSLSGNQIFFLSEKDGTQNIYSMTPAGGSVTQLTRLKDYPVRALSVATDNTLCYSWNGEIYTLAPGGQPKKVQVLIANETPSEIEKNIPINSNVSEYALSPNGKEIAFVSRGEVFVASVENGQTKRITNTPQQERMIEWAPDGKSIIYAAERKGSWDIYRTSRTRASEPYFYASTVLAEEPVIQSAAEEFLPKFSPDGKEIAYVENRNILKVYNLATKATRTLLPEGHNHSYSDGDWGFQWSPDGKWIITDDQRGFFFSANNAALIKADGSGKIVHPVNSGFGEGAAKWGMNGKILTWTSDRFGRRSAAVQGSREVDVFALFFDRNEFDKYKLSKDEFALFKEAEEKAKKDSAAKTDEKTKAKKNTKEKAEASKTLATLDLEGASDRIVKLTGNSASISDYAVNKDASKIFYLAAFERGYDLWVTEPRTRESRILAKLGGSPSGIEMSKDEKTLIVSNSGRLVKIDAESGKISPININGEMTLNTANERAYIYEHAWRQVREKFYQPELHNVNWDAYKSGYERFLPHISNNFDFQELLSELLGELNASHTGGRYSPQFPAADRTAALGLLSDETYTGKGIKITEILGSGPVDKTGSKVRAGQIIEKINGRELDETEDGSRLLNRELGKTVLLSLYDPATRTHFEEPVKTISFEEENELMYKRWVKTMRAMVDKLSDGKVGYVHVRGMNDDSYREVLDAAGGINLEKQALIVDTRFNGGGWLHNDLNTFLSGKSYLNFTNRGKTLKGTEPVGTWTKPSVVLMSEGNYSDAFIFPYIYKQTGTGKLIGMPVAGTGTAVWWEQQIDPTIVFGIPMFGTVGKEGRTTENLQVEPDIRVDLPYSDFLNGKDPQIEAAVKEMLQQTAKK